MSCQRMILGDPAKPSTTQWVILWFICTSCAIVVSILGPSDGQKYTAFNHLALSQTEAQQGTQQHKSCSRSLTLHRSFHPPDRSLQSSCESCLLVAGIGGSKQSLVLDAFLVGQMQANGCHRSPIPASRTRVVLRCCVAWNLECAVHVRTKHRFCFEHWWMRRPRSLSSRGQRAPRRAPPFPKGSERALFPLTSCQPPLVSHERVPRSRLSPLMPLSCLSPFAELRQLGSTFWGLTMLWAEKHPRHSGTLLRPLSHLPNCEHVDLSTTHCVRGGARLFGIVVSSDHVPSEFSVRLTALCSLMGSPPLVTHLTACVVGDTWEVAKKKRP